MADPIASWTRLGPGDYRRTPWKNGGGVTVDIADAFTPGATPGGWAGMIWRFGHTRISRPGPFSDLSGYDRILAVIEGRGLLLRSPEAEALHVREPFRPVRFPGERPIESALEDGPVGVLNLMADRRRAGIGLVFMTEPTATMVGPGTAVLYAPAGEASFKIAGRAVTLAEDHAIRLEAQQPLPLDHAAGVLAMALIEPTR